MPNEDQSNTGAVTFLQFHRPKLPDGDYEITVKQTVSITNHPKIEPFTTTKQFSVAGERFDLKPTDVLAVFPPDGNLGEHSNVLPHIILERSTLPWERMAEVDAEGEGEWAPWLALLLFYEEEKPKPQILTVKELLHPPADAGEFPPPAVENAQHPDDKLTVIDVKRSLLETLMPAAEELKLLAHARVGGDPVRESAVIISNRLPQPGKTSTAHLVSVERRYAKGKKAGGSPEEYGFDYGDANGDKPIRLVSLKSWSFTCENPAKSFKGLLLGLNKPEGPPATLRLPESANVTGLVEEKTLLSKGYVLLPHYLRQGARTASCYHGPLIPGTNAVPELDLPARAADELVRYDPTLGMFDVSYAAAWELGRLLALRDKGFSTGLYLWKRRHSQQLAQAKQQAQASHVPFQKTTAADVPAAVSSWFESLRKLKGVPFNYLVPDERMLPVESIRFFRVDGDWLNCLADGAFSIGRVASSDFEKDKSHAEDSPAAPGSSDPVTGFLLRSEVVSGWPGLLVDAYSDQDGLRRVDPPSMERLAADVLICLFSGEVARVEIHQKPETLHFGLDVPPEKKEDSTKEDSTAGYFKNLRVPESGAQAGGELALDPSHWRLSPLRTLDIAALAQSLRGRLKFSPENIPPPPTLTSAQFALQMVEGVENVIFLVNKPD